MLKKYEHLIYANVSEKKKVENECIDLVVKEHREYSKEKILELILSDKPNDIDSDYQMYILMTEGSLLFDKAAKKFGDKLWQSKAWKNKTCKRRCPFGDVCRKYLVKIDNECFCYGQLYFSKITENKILEMLKEHNIQLLNSNGSVYIDLNNADDYKRQFFGSFFFEYEWFIWWFGDDGGRKDKKVNGNNVIQLL